MLFNKGEQSKEVDLLVKVAKGMEPKDFGKGEQIRVIPMQDMSAMKKGEKQGYLDSIANETNRDKLAYATPYTSNRQKRELVKDENGEPVLNDKGKNQYKASYDENGKPVYTQSISISGDDFNAIKTAAGSKGVAVDKNGNTYYAVKAKVDMDKGVATPDWSTVQPSSIDKTLTQNRLDKQFEITGDIINAKNARSEELKTAEKAAKDASLAASASKSAPDAPAKDSAEKGLGE